MTPTKAKVNPETSVLSFELCLLVPSVWGFCITRGQRITTIIYLTGATSMCATLLSPFPFLFTLLALIDLTGTSPLATFFTPLDPSNSGMQCSVLQVTLFDLLGRVVPAVNARASDAGISDVGTLGIGTLDMGTSGA